MSSLRFRFGSVVVCVFSTFFFSGCGERTAPPAPAKAEGIPVQTKQLTYEEDVAEWHRVRAERLQTPDGWLSLIGLFWLEEGENRFGSDPKGAVVLPQSAAPPVVGSITVEKGIPYLVPAANSGVPPARQRLTTDAEGTKPNILRFGSVSMYVIKRGERLGVRVKDSESATRKNFKGLEYFPTDPKWKVEARVEPYSPPKKIPITDITGATSDSEVPGALVFTVDGKEYRLDPIIEEGDTDYFIIVADQTNGHETYGGGRYYYASPPGADGKVIIDFNKAYNPPCVFSPYATCPLPPKQNHLPVRIEAGEKMYEHEVAGDAPSVPGK